MKQTEFAKSIMQSRYSYPGETTWEEIANRVSTHISSVELNGDIPKYKEQFYTIINDGDFIPGGRILYGSGRPGVGLMNCFALEMQDNRHSIADGMSNTYLISVAGGGVGINMSNIRPKGDPIRNTPASAPGVISEMKKIDSIGEQVRSGGGRRAALLTLLNISHPDTLEFIDVKLDKTVLTNHNISLGITKDFLKAVRKNKSWYFTFNKKKYGLWKFLRKNPDGRYKTDEVIIPAVSKDDAEKIADVFYKIRYDDEFEFIEEYVLMARDLWQKIVDSNLKSGEPGFLFVDNIEKYFNNQYFQKFSAPNPCLVGETNVITNHGVMTLDDCINKFKDGVVMEILSFNENTNTNEMQKIVWGDKTRENANIIELELEDGKKIKLTPDHEIYTENRGYVKASQLTDEDEIIVINDVSDYCNSYKEELKLWKSEKQKSKK